MTAGFVVKAALLLTDKRTWKVIGAIAAGIGAAHRHAGGHPDRGV